MKKLRVLVVKVKIALKVEGASFPSDGQTAEELIRNVYSSLS